MSAPDHVIVRGPPSNRWQAEGVVIGRAPFSVQVWWKSPAATEETMWFVWERGNPRHGKQHGVPAEFAMQIEEGTAG